MTWQMAVIGVYRVTGSLPVLRWPFIGGLVALLCDLGDLFLMDWLGGVRNYQSFDKYLDQVYMLTFLVVVLTWTGLPRTVGVALYVYRLFGFIAFELTGARYILLSFPNLFEVWFLFVAGLGFFKVGNPASKWQVWFAGVSLGIAKVMQEYVLHFAKLLDGFTAFDAVSTLWHWLTNPFQ